MSSRYPRYSYRGRTGSARFGAAGYRGRVGKRVYRKRSVSLARASRYRMMNVASRGYIGMGRVTEQKFKDISGTLAVNSTGAVLLLNGIEQGTTPSTRIGSILRMQKLQFQLEGAVTSGTGVDQWHRYMLVYDRQTNGSALTGALVLTAFDTRSFQLLENRDRFQVLYDHKIALNAYGESGSHKPVSGQVSLNLPVVYIAGAGTIDTIADIKTGSLYFLCVGTLAAGATAGAVDCKFRLWFTDK